MILKNYFVFYFFTELIYLLYWFDFIKNFDRFYKKKNLLNQFSFNRFGEKKKSESKFPLRVDLRLTRGEGGPLISGATKNALPGIASDSGPTQPLRSFRSSQLSCGEAEIAPVVVFVREWWSSGLKVQSPERERDECVQVSGGYDPSLQHHIAPS